MNLVQALKLPKVELLASLPTPTLTMESVWYYHGTGAACLVAHVDTVWDDNRQTPRVLKSKDLGLLWSPDGLGGDDRVGVFIGLYLVSKLKCSLLLCDKEESGGWGARYAADNPEVREKLQQHKFLVGLDRKNGSEFVCYGRESRRFKKWVGRVTGLKEASGTFSDITILTRKLGIPGVNISVGFHNEHSHGEYVLIDEIRQAVTTATRLLTLTPPSKIELPKWEPQTYCDFCDQTIDSQEAKSVKRNGVLWVVCKECLTVPEESFIYSGLESA